MKIIENIALVRVINAAFEGMKCGAKYKMNKEVKRHLKADTLCDFTDKLWEIEGINNDGTIDIRGTGGSTFTNIDISTLDIIKE